MTRTCAHQTDKPVRQIAPDETKTADYEERVYHDRPVLSPSLPILLNTRVKCNHSPRPLGSAPPAFTPKPLRAVSMRSRLSGSTLPMFTLETKRLHQPAGQ